MDCFTVFCACVCLYEKLMVTLLAQLCVYEFGHVMMWIIMYSSNML